LVFYFISAQIYTAVRWRLIGEKKQKNIYEIKHSAYAKNNKKISTINILLFETIKLMTRIMEFTSHIMVDS